MLGPQVDCERYSGVTGGELELLLLGRGRKAGLLYWLGDGTIILNKAERVRSISPARSESCRGIVHRQRSPGNCPAGCLVHCQQDTRDAGCSSMQRVC